MNTLPGDKYLDGTQRHLDPSSWESLYGHLHSREHSPKIKQKIHHPTFFDFTVSRQAPSRTMITCFFFLFAWLSDCIVGVWLIIISLNQIGLILEFQLLVAKWLQQTKHIEHNYWLIPKNGRLLNALALYTVVAEISIRQGSQRWEGTQSEGLATWNTPSRLGDEHFGSVWKEDELVTGEFKGIEEETSSEFFSFELLLRSCVCNLDMFSFFFLSCFTSRKEQKSGAYIDTPHVDAGDKDRSLR